MQLHTPENFAPRAPRSQLSLWTVYNRPKEFPGHFVARKFMIAPDGAYPTEETFKAKELADVRREMEKLGLFRMHRSPGDDDKIVETWI